MEGHIVRIVRFGRAVPSQAHDRDDVPPVKEPIDVLKRMTRAVLVIAQDGPSTGFARPSSQSFSILPRAFVGSARRESSGITASSILLLLGISLLSGVLARPTSPPLLEYAT